MLSDSKWLKNLLLIDLKYFHKKLLISKNEIFKTVIIIRGKHAMSLPGKQNLIRSVYTPLTSFLHSFVVIEYLATQL